MPYAIRKKGNQYLTVNKETGKVKGTHASYAKAERQRRLLEGVEHGWKPTGKKAKKPVTEGARKRFLARVKQRSKKG